MLKINTAISNAVTTITKSTEARDKATVKPIDTLWAEGARSADFKSPAEGLDQTFYVEAKKAVVAGFTVAEKRLLSANTKTLAAAAKAHKKIVQQKIGARMGDVARLLKAREPKADKAPSGQTNQTATAAPAENNSSATPLKSYIEKVSTGRAVLKAIPPSQLSVAKQKKIEKLIGDLLEELNQIK